MSDPDAGMWVQHKTPLEPWCRTPSGKPGEEGAPEERPGPCSAPRLPTACPSASSSVQGPCRASRPPPPHTVTPKPFLLEAEVHIFKGDLSHPQISIPTGVLLRPPAWMHSLVLPPGCTAAPLEGAAASPVLGTHTAPPPHSATLQSPAGPPSQVNREPNFSQAHRRVHTHTATLPDRVPCPPACPRDRGRTGAQGQP